MKIFWAWQSDTPGNIGRFFVRDVLNAAIKQLKSEAEVVEPTEREALGAMDLDHDRKGVPGSPDLARTILEKIEAASVVVADVTPVGLVPPVEGNGGRPPKRLINSNVAIEMGYALRFLGDRSLLMVMNTHYGKREDLPFDVAHKAGPIMFNLAPDTDRAMIASVAKELKGHFVEAIKLCIAHEVQEKKSLVPFPATKPVGNPAMFFPFGTILGPAGNPGEQEFSFSYDRIVYMRIHPVSGAVSVGRAKVSQIFTEKRPMVMMKGNLGGAYLPNDYGAIIFDLKVQNSLAALTQGFPSGELWGMNGVLFQPCPIASSGPRSNRAGTCLPMVTFEQVYRQVLRNYVRVEALLGLEPPYTVILGAVGLKNVYLAVPTGGPTANGSYQGPIRDNGIERTFTLNAVDNASIDDVLREYFNEIYDMASIRRADVWTANLTTAHDLPSL